MEVLINALEMLNCSTNQKKRRYTHQTLDDLSTIPFLYSFGQLLHPFIFSSILLDIGHVTQREESMVYFEGKHRLKVVFFSLAYIGIG